MGAGGSLDGVWEVVSYGGLRFVFEVIFGVLQGSFWKV